MLHSKAPLPDLDGLYAHSAVFRAPVELFALGVTKGVCNRRTDGLHDVNGHRNGWHDMRWIDTNAGDEGSGDYALERPLRGHSWVGTKQASHTSPDGWRQIWMLWPVNVCTSV